MEKSRCTGVLTLPPVYQKLMVENLTVIRPPMLKLYYWESFDISGLNKKLKSNKQEHEHDICIPLRQIHSQPLKIIFWLRNLSEKPLMITLKRIQNCQCVPMPTRVGYNQFRQLFHCPHRRLIHLQQEVLRMQPDEVLALTVTANFFLYGHHWLTYEVLTDDKRKFLWHFKLEISAFDPEKCLLTKELLPVNIKHFQRVTQPIWVQNMTMMNLNYTFSSRDPGLKLHNSNLMVPRQSVWPLLVEYRPMDYDNDLEITLSYDNSKARYKIKARGVLTDDHEETDMPIKDKECSDYLYVIYPNRLSFNICPRECRKQIVNVHNYGQKCMEFRWQNYIISEFFSVTFEPTVFNLKGHHSKLCEIKVIVWDRLMHFRRIPIVLEVHRILDRATKIAKAELEEIESIDDPKWKEDSYLEHVFLHLNIRIIIPIPIDDDADPNVADNVEAKFFDDAKPCCGCAPVRDLTAGGDAGNAGSVAIAEPPPKTPQQLRHELIRRLSQKRKLTANEIIELSMAIDQRVTIFEKLFWRYLSKSNFMRISADRSNLRPIKTYKEVVNPNISSPLQEESKEIDLNLSMEILSRLMLEAINDLAKNWTFIPPQYYERQI